MSRPLCSVLLVLLAGCGDEQARERRVAERRGVTVLPACWQRIAGLRIYFGHMSVGTNIVDGLRELSAEAPDARLNIVETKNPAEVRGPVFAHSRIGSNGEPIAKLRAFVNAMDAEAGEVDLAFFKLCFVDVTAGTDVRAVFEAYRSAMAGLRQRRPERLIAHVTVPLTTMGGGLKARMKRWLGGTPNGYADNAARAEYNSLLRSAYSGKEPLFDLAAAESLAPDGRPTEFSHGGRTCQALAPAFTEDGGHLNRPGRRQAAVRLAEMLCSLQVVR